MRIPDKSLNDREIAEICDKIIALLSPYNPAIKYKVIKSLYDGLLETLKENGYIIEEIVRK